MDEYRKNYVLAVSTYYQTITDNKIGLKLSNLYRNLYAFERNVVSYPNLFANSNLDGRAFIKQITNSSSSDIGGITYPSVIDISYINGKNNITNYLVRVVTHS
jgi:hypothetical protein